MHLCATVASAQCNLCIKMKLRRCRASKLFPAHLPSCPAEFGCGDRRWHSYIERANASTFERPMPIGTEKPPPLQPVRLGRVYRRSPAGAAARYAAAATFVCFELMPLMPWDASLAAPSPVPLDPPLIAAPSPIPVTPPFIHAPSPVPVTPPLILAPSPVPVTPPLILAPSPVPVEPPRAFPPPPRPTFPSPPPMALAIQRSSLARLLRFARVAVTAPVRYGKVFP